MKRSLFCIPLAYLSVALGVLVLGTPAVAQSQDITIGGVTLTLGDSRADTMEAAESRLMVMSSRTAGYYNLYRKVGSGSNGNVQSLAIGALRFRDDRLVGVTRNLGAFQSYDGRAAIDNLIAAFSQGLEDNPPRRRTHRPDGSALPLPQLTAKTEDMETDNFSISRIYFSFPDRTIQIAVFQPADAGKQASIAVSEEYGLHQTPTER